MMLAGALTARLSGVPWKPARQIASHKNLDGRTLTGRFKNPATPQPFRPLRFSKRPLSAYANLPLTSDCCIYQVREKDFVQRTKKQEAANRMAAIRRARRDPKAAAKEKRRASLVGDEAKWRITNLKRVARAMGKWA